MLGKQYPGATKADMADHCQLDWPGARTVRKSRGKFLGEQRQKETQLTFKENRRTPDQNMIVW